MVNTREKSEKSKRPKMVGWYNPLQLAKTGIEVAISTIFGRHSDRRLLQAAAKVDGRPSKPFFDLSQTEGDLWVDYVADVGDGFNPTCTVAYYLTEPTLTLKKKQEGKGGTEEKSYETKAGHLLIFGGDEVYPIARKDFYYERLVGPYNAVFQKKKKPDPNAPVVFAIPGNHDWYDSLAQFSFLFLEEHFGSQRSFCGWRSEQERSYFAIKLPAGWWLFGTDMQLGSTLDTPQMEYFRNVIENEMQPNDRVILCNAEPHWITRAMYPDNPDYDNRNLGFFEGRVLENRAVIFIAGDRHYYRRHEEQFQATKNAPDECAPRKQRIVAGGGGAFLHPTHKEHVDTVGERPKYDLKASFPTPAESRVLNFRNLLFIFWNWRFGFATGALYLLTAHAFMSNLGKYPFSAFFPAFRAVVHDALTQPFALVWIALILAGFVLFTDTSSRAYRWIAGPLHGLAHLAGVFLVSWLAARIIDPFSGINYDSILQLLLSAALIFAGGYVFGAVIMGFYLFISLNVFGRHHNEAFSALKIEDYKNFLRLRIAENGDLTIYPVGVRKAITSWPDTYSGRIVPETIADDNRPFLIEDPICFAPQNTTEGG